MAFDVALDIGTSHTRLATSSRGVLFDEPTMVAIDTNSGEVQDLGHGALELDRTYLAPRVVFRPFNQGATVDFDVTARLIEALFDRAGVSKMSRARVVMSVPSLATAIERRALRQAAIQAGAREATPDRGATRRRHWTWTAGPRPRGIGRRSARRGRLRGGRGLPRRHRGGRRAAHRRQRRRRRDRDARCDSTWASSSRRRSSRC